MKIISWNLLRLIGARVDDVAALIEEHRPDLMLMQEATVDTDRLVERAGGFYTRHPLPGRIHGLAVWSPVVLPQPATIPLQRGTLIPRIAQIIEVGDIAIANVHLSHGQLLNRRQLRRTVSALAATGANKAAVLGDYNLVGPALLPGFTDAGPRQPTHRMSELVPLRIDRCYIRGLACERAEVLGRGRSDHKPIMVELQAA
ncbi:MAG TPA: endonuclease/exonuclease/phosphatase family protein [Stellaceae bacterium]|nr:endonuclease/exonuclease/phosphatase family protein [Stellaceae bacterium]